jgi:hypothetical protein
MYIHIYINICIRENIFNGYKADRDREQEKCEQTQMKRVPSEKER